MPADIPPARSTNLIVGIGLLLMAWVPLLPIYGTLRYDGIGYVLEWPLALYGFLAVGVLMLATAANLLLRPQRVGAEVAFHENGFTLAVRAFLRRDRRHSLAWADIENMTLIEAPRGGDLLAFRLTHAAGVREGLIQPTARAGASRTLARREVRLPLALLGVSISEAVTRFHASAEVAGAQLVVRSSFNVLIFVRKLWSVEWP